MKPITSARLAAGLALLLPALSLAFAQQPGREGVPAEDGSVGRLYRVDHIDLQDAMLLAHQICLQEAKGTRCEYRSSGSTWFTYFATPAVQGKIAAALEKSDVPPRSLNFRLALLLAGDEPGGDPKLPPGERQALEDLKQFLPYRGYRLIDAGWIRSSESARLRLGSDPSFDMEMRFERGSDEFGSWIRVVRFELTKLIPFSMGPGGLTKYSPQELLSSSFSMSIGETVVVGTSKLNGNKEALVVLLTAEE